jgi:hypothetical protein
VKRPIAASHLSIVRIYSAVESDRSVVASSINVIKTLTISGQLPIVASYLHVKETYAVTWNRTVASNQVSNSELLMKFLD